MPPGRQTLDPDCCPEHARHCERLDRSDARLEMLEEGERDHEHRITVIEVEGKSWVRAASSVVPIAVALISAAVAVWSATRRQPEPQTWQHDTHSYTAPAAPASHSASRP